MLWQMVVGVDVLWLMVVGDDMLGQMMCVEFKLPRRLLLGTAAYAQLSDQKKFIFVLSIEVKRAKDFY